MNNVYATPAEIKAAAPDAVRTGTTKYDILFLRLAGAISRFIEGRTGRVFTPSYGTKYLAGDGSDELVVPDLLALDSLATSLDGQTFTAMTTDDWYGAVFEDENSPKSWRTLVATRWGQIGIWPVMRRGVRITGWWGYADQRDEAWEDSGVTLAVGYSANGAALAVADKDAVDSWGFTALHAGRILRVDNEIFEVKSTGDGTPNDLAQVRYARNGSTAAGHDAGAAIKIWRVADAVKQACIIQAVRQLERGLQGFGDARATPELGQTLYIKKLDPEADLLLQGYLVLR